MRGCLAEMFRFIFYVHIIREQVFHDDIRKNCVTSNLHKASLTFQIFVFGQLKEKEVTDFCILQLHFKQKK